jgi:hypothetical protein
MTVLAVALEIDDENPIVGDRLIRNGQLVLAGEGQTEPFSHYVAQNLRQRFLRFKGTWFLDLREGIPYFERVLIKAPDLRALESMFKIEVIQKTPGVASINFFQLSFDRANRLLGVDFSVRAADGSTVTAADISASGPFIITGDF